MDNLDRSFNGTFRFDFPTDIVQTGKGSIPSLSPRELEFYNKYVGIYLKRDQLDPEYFSRRVYRVETLSNDWGVAYYYSKWANRIDYDDRSKKFYVAEGGGSEEIKNLEAFEVPKTWIRVGSLCWPQVFGPPTWLGSLG